MWRQTKLVRFIFIFFSLISSAIFVEAEEVPAKIVSSFGVIPTSIQLVGTAGVSGSILVQPQEGYTIATFPVTPGSYTLQIPEQTIYFPPYFPPVIQGPSGPMVPISISPNGYFNFTAVFPATTIQLPYPIPDTSTEITVPVIPTLNLKIEQAPFIITTYTTTPPLTPIALQPMPAVTEIPLLPISVLTIAINETKYRGELNYTLNVQSNNPGGPWSWNIGGTWYVTIHNSAYADLKHQQNFNTYGGALTSVTEPPVATLEYLPVTKTYDGGDIHPKFQIQFSKQKMEANHILTFDNPTYGKTDTLPFNSVAYIALGQWMRQMGNPTLKLSAPYTGNNSITWTVPIGEGKEMILRWKME